MPKKKPSSAPARPGPPPLRSAPPAAPNVRLQQAARWQRTKRYGWDSR